MSSGELEFSHDHDHDDTRACSGGVCVDWVLR
mgnify:CR=1 FL=1